MKQSFKLPVPDSTAQHHSLQLLDIIKSTIAASPDGISFADYMQLCLYTPGLGYYSAGSHKLGQGGDFTTAPEISSLFSQALARHIEDALRQCSQRYLIEFGAGSGQMALDILLALQQRDGLPQCYFIIEASADLRQRQQQKIAAYPELAERVHWLDTMPDNMEGVIVANELCDAMPIHLLYFDKQQVWERGVGWEQDRLQWHDRPVSLTALAERASQIQAMIAPESYLTEVNLAAEGWLHSVAARMVRGAIFIIDYGYPQSEYYHPQRRQGTLMCHYQHHAHDDPFLYPGLQDITAHVDFTALAEAALNSGLSVASFQTQADFLVAGDIIEISQANQAQDDFDKLKQAAELKRLLLPQQMGETFKALSLTKQIDALPRLRLNDRRYQL